MIPIYCDYFERHLDLSVRKVLETGVMDQRSRAGGQMGEAVRSLTV